MADDRRTCSDTGRRDWTGDWRTLAGLWGAPGAIMIAAGWLAPTPRAALWVLMLLWMAAACFLNARRCSRTHCRLTGPFFLVMAAAVVAYAVGVLPLGPNGWVILAVVVLMGFAALWWGSERVWGRFTR